MPGQSELLDRLTAGGVVFDGAMGSMLIARGLPAGHPTEHWNLTNADAVSDVHRAYLDAGADVVTSNTFGSTPARMQRHDLLDGLSDINRAGVRLARERVDAIADARYVALSLGPTGMMLPPLGDATGEKIEGEFRAQLDCIDGGFDLVLIETMFDVKEALLALNAARACTKSTVAVAMTFNRTPRGFYTVMGDDVATAVGKLEAAGADVIAANCSIASGDMLDLAPLLRGATTLPVLCQPNAGQPRMEGAIPMYDQTPDAFADDAAKLFDLGINAVGGCCGTDPDYIRALRERMTR